MPSVTPDGSRECRGHRDGNSPGRSDVPNHPGVPRNREERDDEDEDWEWDRRGSQEEEMA